MPNCIPEVQIISNTESFYFKGLLLWSFFLSDERTIPKILFWRVIIPKVLIVFQVKNFSE